MYVVLDSVDSRKFALYTGISLCTGLLELPLGDGCGATVRMIQKMLPSLADGLQEAEPVIADALRECVATLERYQLHPRSCQLFSEHEASLLHVYGLLADAIAVEADRDGDLKTAASKPHRSRSR